MCMILVLGIVVLFEIIVLYLSYCSGVNVCRLYSDQDTTIQKEEQWLHGLRK